MNTKINNETVISPNTFVISSYVNCDNITQKVTPDIKHRNGSSIIFVDLSYGHCRLGGSQYCQEIGNLNFESLDLKILKHFLYI